MKRHRNTLYVTTQGAYLSTEGETAVVKTDGEIRLRVPLHLLEGIVCFGRVSCSPVLMHRCSERSVGISFLTEHGRFLARVEGPVSGNVLLRREQFRRADDPEGSAALARMFVAAKIASSRSVMQRRLRDHPDAPGTQAIRAALALMARKLRELRLPMPLDTIRGIEGDAARAYFGAFDHLIVQQKGAFRFAGRSRRPPLDEVNAMLSFAYTLIRHDVSSSLEAVGLDPQVGFLHRDRPGRSGLALDMMEEFRPFLADRLVLSLINRLQVSASGFEKRETGGVYMDDDTRRVLLSAYQKRKEEEILHPFLGEKTTVGMLVQLQCRIVARFLRGDLEAYPPFHWK